MSDIRLQDPLRNSLDDIIEQAQQDLDLERKRQEAIITSEEPDKVLSGLNKVEKQIENEPVEVQRSVLDKAYNPGYFDRGVRGGNISRPIQQENKPLIKPGLNPGEVGQWQGFINAIKSGYKQGEQARAVIGLEGGLEAEERLKEIALLQAEIRGIPRSKAYNEFNDPKKTFGQSLKRLALDPIEITSQLVVESLFSFLPTQIAGAVTGAGIGAGVGTIVPGIGTVAGAGSGFLYGGITSAGLTSLGVEYSGKMLEVMEELGVNIEDPNDLARGFSNDGIMSEARELGLRKGVPIAIFDLVSAGVAGRFSKPGRTLAGKFIQGSKEVGTQAVLGSSGEAVGQLSAGEEIQPSAIIAEGIAEIGQSAPSGATRIATERFKTQKQERAKAKGIEALESGQLRSLSDQEITDFASSLTPEERMEVGISEDGQFEIESDLGKEVVRRNLDMDKFPETEKEIREASARLNIKEQQLEGTDFTGALIDKIEASTNIKVEREFLDRTLADEAEEQGWTEAETKQVLKEHGLDENSDPSQIDLTGTSFGGSIKISTAGTPERMAQEYVAVQEEMAEEYYKAEQQNDPNFESEIERDRKAYYEATGEQDTGESNIEWFSTKAVHFATQGKVHESIGAKLRDIFKRFIDTSKQILKDAIKLRRAIKEGKVPDSLLKKLEEATDFKTVGKKVEKVSKDKKTYRLSKKEGSELVWENIPLKKQPNLLELTKYFTSKAQEASKKLGVDLTENTPEALNIISNVIAEEINIETGNEQNALGWYSVKMQNAIELLGQIHPELINNDEHNQVFKIALAITSNGAPVEDNLKNAVSAYEYWRENNSLPTNFKQGGKEAPAMATAFKLYNKLVSDNGVDAVHSFINTQFTVKEIKDMGYPVNGELVTEKVMGAVIFGPKVGGGFLSNLNGHYEYLTMDRWFMRTIGRIRGNLKDNKDYTNQLKRFKTALRVNPTKMKEYGITKEQLSNDETVIEVARKVLKDYAKKKLVKKDNKYRTFYPKTKLNKASNTLVKVIDSIHEAPANGTERKFLREIMEKAVDKSNIDGLTMADAQAIIWFPEKRIFSNFGVGSQRGKKETDYEIEARRYVKQRIGRVQPIGSSAVRERTAQRDSAKDQQNDQNLGNQEKTNEEVKPSYRLTPTFYSQAERTVTAKFPPSMKSQSVENFLKKNQVKPEEIEWLDLESLLKGKQKVTKEELQEWIQANKIEIQDVTFGQYKEDPKAKKQLVKAYEKRSQELNWFLLKTITKNGITYDRFKLSQVIITGEGASTKIIENLRDGREEPIGYFSNKNYEVYGGVENTLEYTDRLNSLHKLEKEINVLESKEAEMREKKDTEYESYQLPGEKEDYRELLLTLPPQPMTFEEFEADAKSIGLTDQQAIKRQYINYLKDPGEDFSKDRNFKTSHFKQSNILAHVRFNTRISPTGERILFIEELQSDWHTEGRSKGYKSRKKITKLPEGYTVEKRLGTQYRVLDPNGERFTSDFLSEEFAVKNAIEKLRKIGVPNAPFKNNGWIELIMKRMLRHASDNNFDRIAWTTSNQQVDRWKNDLRQNVDQIQWQKNMLGVKSLAQFTAETEQITGMEVRSDIAQEMYNQYVEEEIEAQRGMASTVIINGLKNKENKFNQTIPLEGETTINGQKVTLEGLLGKQMATQIRNSNKRTGIIEGDDLTIGGQGFKVVYDFAISKILNKMGKKFGAKVDQVNMPTQKVGIPKEVTERIKQLRFKKQEIVEMQIDALAVPSTMPPEDVQAYTDRLDIEKKKINKEIQKLESKYKNVMTDNAQPSIKITRKMKEFALKGQPTFRLSKMSSTDEVLESSSFKKWFKGSKVVDKQGKPLVVYHGTAGNFNIFKTPSYFSDENMVSEFIMEPIEIFNVPPIGENMIPVYLSLQNPKIYTTEKEYDNYVMENPGFAENIKSLKTQGFDGIIYKPNDGGSNYYISFEPNQIKSVFNKGTFNPNDPRISFRLSPKNIVTPLAKVYQEQKGDKKSYTKKDFEKDLARLGYDDDMIKSAMDMFGIIRMKEIETTDPTPIEKELKKLQEREIKKNEVKSRIQRAYKLGAREKEKEITKLQKIVTNYARQNLPKGLYQKSEVTGILAKVRDAKRFRQLSTAMERIDRVIDKVSKRAALAKFNKTIKKKAIVKKVGGVPKGQVGAEVQEIVNDIRSVYKLSEAEVENRLELLLDIIDKSADGQPTDLQSMQMHNLMTYGAIKSKTPQQIVTATQSFDLLVTDGRMQIMEENQAYKTRMASVREEILNIVTGGAGAQTQQGEQALGLKPKDWSEFRKMISQFDNNSQSLEYIFDKLSRLDKTSSPLQSFLNNYFMPQIRQARLAEYGGTTEMITMMKNKLEEIYGLKGGKLRRKLNENIENTITITHHDKISPEGIKGDIVESTFTYNQAYKKWMELKDPTLHKTFVKMGYDVNKVINQIEQQLPKEVIAWAEWQLYEFYPMYYQRVNETFRRRFFVNLPFNPMYSPIKRLIGAKSDTADPTLDKKKTPFGSVQNGSMKSRVGSQEELAWVDGDTILLGHVAEMEHFIAYTDVLRELRSVFMSRDISRSIQQFHGKPILRVLNKFIDDIARGGIDKSNSVEGIDYLRGNFSRSAIGLNPVVFLKQLGSIPAYASDMPLTQWLKEFALLSNPIEVRKMLKTLSESKLLDMRYEVGMERDIALAMRSVKPGNVFTGTDMLNNIAYLLTKLGDKTAIYLGGYPLYKYEYKQAKKNGATDEEAKKIAMKKFEASTLRAQQSGEIEDLSEVQRSGTYAKLFTMFMTSPNQYYRMSIGGWRNLKERRGTKAENIRRIFVAQFVLPTLFTYIANGFEYDEEDHITSLILFPFAGIMFFGQAFQTVIDRLGGKNYGSAGEVSILEPFNDIGRLASRIRQIQLGKKDLDSKQVLLMVNDLVIAMSRVLGLPYAGVKRSVLGAIKVVKGEAQNPVRETIGFKPKKKEKKKPVRSTAEPIFRP